jgi:hypothetical protein
MKNYLQSFLFLLIVSFTLSIFSLPSASPSPYVNQYSLIASASAETTSEEATIAVDKAALLEQIQAVLDSSTTAEAKANAKNIYNIVKAFPEKGSEPVEYVNWITALSAGLGALITFLILTFTKVKGKK